MSVTTHTRAVIHIGPQKTGTTHLARYLTLAAEKLAGQGVIYPMGDLWFENTKRIVKHHQLQDGPFESKDALVSTMSELAALAGTTAQASVLGRSTTIFVTETASALLSNPGELERFTLTYSDEVTFVFLARKQDKAFASIIAQRIKEISNDCTSLKIDDYLTSEHKYLTSIDYADLLAKWTSGDPRSRVIALPYVEDESDLLASIERFFNVLELEMPPVQAPALKNNKLNPSFSEQGLREIAEFKKRRQKLPLSLLSPEKKKERFEELVKKHHQVAHGVAGVEQPLGFEAWSLPEEEAQRVLGKYLPSNRSFLESVDRARFVAEWDAWETSVLRDFPRS
jgi:hypothetical protein